MLGERMSWSPSPHHEPSLSEGDLDPEPMQQFAVWMADAVASGELMPSAVAMATVDEDGLPSVRMLQLEHFDERGFVLQTNLGSPKAAHLRRRPRVALAFFWPRLMRQVRVTGAVAPLARAEVNGYFALLPDGVKSMLRACRQSEVIADRARLERLYAEAVASGDLTLPDEWGGYLVTVESIEFWQGRANWLQDRLRYSRLSNATDGAEWRIERLIP